jgi:hypothetical protein
MPRFTLLDAEGIANRNRPWTIRLEFHGSNLTNASGVSSKYWYATGRGLNEKVETGWGAIGSAPQHQLIDWAELRVRVADKQSKGYKWADTPYVRMSKASLATLTGNPIVPSNPVVPATPVTSVQVPLKTNPPLAALSPPFCLIHALRILRDGVKLIGYKALDAAGDELMQMPPADGIKFAQQYDIEIKFV